MSVTTQDSLFAEALSALPTFDAGAQAISSGYDATEELAEKVSEVIISDARNELVAHILVENYGDLAQAVPADSPDEFGSIVLEVRTAAQTYFIASVADRHGVYEYTCTLKNDDNDNLVEPFSISANTADDAARQVDKAYLAASSTIS